MYKVALFIIFKNILTSRNHVIVNAIAAKRLFAYSNSTLFQLCGLTGHVHIVLIALPIQVPKHIQISDLWQKSDLFTLCLCIYVSHVYMSVYIMHEGANSCLPMPIPSNVTTTNFHTPRANISHASPSYNSNQTGGEAIARRSAVGKGIGNKQDNVVWEPLTFDWFLIGSDRRLTWNEIHTGRPEHATAEKTNKQIGRDLHTPRRARAYK